VSKSTVSSSFVFISLFFSLVLAIFPWPSFLQICRPEIVCLVVFYWVFVSPTHFGITFGFSIGLLQSVIEAGVWGAHALGLIVAIYLLERFRKRVMNASLWEQSVLITIFVFVHQVLVAWMSYLFAYPVSFLVVLCTSIFSGFFWPVIFIGFNWVRRTYQISH